PSNARSFTHARVVAAITSPHAIRRILTHLREPLPAPHERRSRADVEGSRLRRRSGVTPTQTTMVHTPPRTAVRSVDVLSNALVGWVFGSRRAVIDAAS